ncbi:BolA family transcriptional regulator [Martelella lutilitoris]|uniref:BolA family transcriptional regulator n=1 Tax=Martelella lutilitoris TaxID=2583532 RepID=A0A7T7KLV7_9HYPH|nr:BolA family transcriptional regulator [Martelella lutilitoris]QQM31085.1 BolA family transcriptional regulator [Martelella lutilitoris]
MSSTAEIETRLRSLFNPERLVLMDESAQHAGHYDEPDAPEVTHLRIRIVSDKFQGMNRLARHRAVNEALAGEIENGLHALAIEAAAPGEKTRW